MSFSTPLSASSQHQPHSTPSSAYPEGPKGPINPYSQPPGAPPILRDVFSSSQQNGSGPPETQASKPTFPPVTAPDPRQPVSQHFGYPGSPRSHPTSSFRSSSLTNNSYTNYSEHPNARSPQAYDQQRQSYPLPQFNNSGSSNFPAGREPFQFSGGPKPEDQRGPFPRPTNDVPYGEAVKRHLEAFDTEMGMNEVRLSPRP